MDTRSNMPPRGRTNRCDFDPLSDPQASAIIEQAEALQQAEHDHDPAAGCTPDCSGWTH
jgi:hypothetical protein